MIKERSMLLKAVWLVLWLSPWKQTCTALCKHSTKELEIFAVCAMDSYPHLLGTLNLCWTIGMCLTGAGRYEERKMVVVRHDILGSPSTFILTAKSVLQW